MNFNEASQTMKGLINDLQEAHTTTEIANAKAALSLFRGQSLPIADKPLRPLRKIARAILEEYEGAVTNAELGAIRQRTANYETLIRRLETINQDQSPELNAALFENAANFVTITQKAVETIKEVRETGIGKLQADELGKIDELLDLMTKIPNRLI